MTADEVLLLEVLDQIEQREARLLIWGLVDGFLTSEEFGDLVEPLIMRLLEEVHDAPLTLLRANQVIDALKARALLFDAGLAGEPRYRSRMAETVRLLFRLRQLFPKHSGPTGWQAAPTLVADYRFIWRRRRYPDRNLTPVHAIPQIAAATGDGYAREALRELVESHGPEFKLARFQVEAAKRILGGFGGPRSQATLVSAGTGSGKTLAFYLPALARAAAHIRRDPANSRWVKALALYPRNELLKDQFAEVYAEARRLDGWLQSRGRRKLLIGAYFGPTPHSAAHAESSNGWRRHAKGLVCEYVSCPKPKCDGDMLWPSGDREKANERLVCLECSSVIGPDEIILTRTRLAQESPDILFTTTEMLNQRMGDSRYRHLFGLGAERPVEMMLLDEVHTYAGATGAQVAFLLRRWRRLLRSRVNFVGLSATLKDGPRFFARLTGLGEQAAVEVAPATRDMIAEGAEYLLALRGDPVSRTALLSTTIQTAMLLQRMLDAPAAPKSGEVFGQRTFLFTDNIDVTNRVYYAMLDAEGRDSWGKPETAKTPLASLRFPAPNPLRQLHGQDWEAAQTIGHGLTANDRKQVGRVMAMDPGVAAGRDIIVATASLEVGFNDPQVGAVIQHKAPRDVAQFLQRKGRAGRSRKMRPWTVVVLSDFGRDRVAYQGYDLLFDPELPVRTLPIGNRYVQRIQAVYATIDYLSLLLASNSRGSVWTNFAEPAKPVEAPAQKARQAALAHLIEKILTNAADQQAYAGFLAQALRLPEEEVAALLWEQPRPLIMEVLPTARRRLETGWRDLPDDGQEAHVRNSPLPEFAPPNLFSDLNLPEVRISLPASATGVEAEPVMMPIAQAMREYAPGRVSRRFGVKHAYERHWLCPDLDDQPVQGLAVKDVGDVDRLGDWSIEGSTGPEVLPVFRPRALQLHQSPSKVLDTSNARLRWRTQIVARHEGLVLEPPQGAPWTPYIADVRFYTHHGMSPVEVRRMALGSEAGIRFLDGGSVSKRIDFEHEGAKAALGFNLQVDAFCLRLRFPEALWSDLGAATSARRRAVRTARFHDQAIHGTYLSTVDNPFARQWLAHLLLAALSNEAIAKDLTLEEAAANLAAGTADLSLEKTLDILFQSAVVDDVDGQANQQDKLRQDLAALIVDPTVRKGLASLAAILWEPITEAWEPWLRDRFAVTVAAAVFQALLALCPEIDGDGLVVDIHAGPREADDVLADLAQGEIWISELAPGGNGHIEEALRQYADDPRRFFGLMSAALRENEFALSDYQLGRFLEVVAESEPDGEIGEATSAFRQAYGALATEQAFTGLREKLAGEGFVTFHGFMVALANRVLRPGSSSESDRFFLQAMREWTSQEQRLGVELDARVLAYRLSRRDDIDAALNFTGIDTPSVNRDQWRMGVVYGLLWPRGAQVRQSGLSVYSPFVDLPAPEPLLVSAYLDPSREPIALDDPQWRQTCLGCLGEIGAASLVCAAEEAWRVAEALNFLATNPVQSNYLSVFARIQAVRRERDKLVVDVDAPEALQ